MATFAEIKTFLAAIVSDNSLGSFHSVNMREFANLTQTTGSSAYLFLMDSATVRGNNQFTQGNRVLRGFSITFFIIKAAKDELTEDQLDTIYSACEELASQFMWLINKGNVTIFNVDQMTTERVKFVSPNTFAGVQFRLEQVRTACNLTLPSEEE